MSKLTVYTDGGSRGNPGESAIGVVITDEKRNNLLSLGERIGRATNNVAEYRAVLASLSWLLSHKKQLKPTEIHVYMDSELIFSQLSGLYKIKNAALRELYFQIKIKEGELGVPVVYSHVRRAYNKEADKLVNRALDFE